MIEEKGSILEHNAIFKDIDQGIQEHLMFADDDTQGPPKIRANRRWTGIVSAMNFLEKFIKPMMLVHVFAAISRTAEKSL